MGDDPSLDVPGLAPEASSADVRSMRRWEGVAVLLCTLGCWTSVPLFLRHLAGYIDHWTNNGWRYGASALLWLPAVVWAVRRGTLPRSVWRAALVPAVLYYYALFVQTDLLAARNGIERVPESRIPALGGVLGARIGRRIPATALRALIVTVALIAAAALWLG